MRFSSKVGLFSPFEAPYFICVNMGFTDMLIEESSVAEFRIREAVFSGCDFAVNYITLVDYDPGLCSSAFENCCFDGCSFIGSTATGLYFRNCSFVGASFASCTMGPVKFINCDFNGASFWETDLEWATFNNSYNLTGAQTSELPASSHVQGSLCQPTPTHRAFKGTTAVAVPVPVPATEKTCINCGHYRTFMQSCPFTTGTREHNVLCSVDRFEPIKRGE